MKILVVGDVHWSESSSIVRSNGSLYSIRLENLIKSVNWAEDLALKERCDFCVYLGDFFDRSEINAKEATALKDIKWNSLAHYMLVGNHEMFRNDLAYSSSNLLELIPDVKVIDSATSMKLDDFTEVCFLPYVLEEKRLKLSEYFTATFPGKRKRIIFSHNDLKGIQLGPIVSKAGFSLDEIHESCEMFVNGHLHNGDQVEPGIINLGNLTGQNFGEDSYKYDHCVGILDTNPLSLSCYENPFAFNFYKLDATQKSLDVSSLKNNSVVTVRCFSSQREAIQSALDCDKIVEKRIIIEPEIKDLATIENDVKTLHLDHIESFVKFFTQTYGASEQILYELGKVSE